MTRGEWELVMAGFGVPLWLAGRVIHRYFALGRVVVADRWQMRVGLGLTIATTVMWWGIFALIALQDHNALIYSLARKANPGEIELLNLCLCIAGLGCSVLRKSCGHQTAKLRNAIAASCGLLAFVWLALALNPH